MEGIFIDLETAKKLAQLKRLNELIKKGNKNVNKK